jgi:hypothetical protein
MKREKKPRRALAVAYLRLDKEFSRANGCEPFPCLLPATLPACGALLLALLVYACFRSLRNLPVVENSFFWPILSASYAPLALARLLPARHIGRVCVRGSLVSEISRDAAVRYRARWRLVLWYAAPLLAIVTVILSYLLNEALWGFVCLCVALPNLGIDGNSPPVVFFDEEYCVGTTRLRYDAASLEDAPEPDGVTPAENFRRFRLTRDGAEVGSGRMAAEDYEHLRKMCGYYAKIDA